MQTTENLSDLSTLLVEVKVELRRIGETRNSDRVQQWCEKAGYLNFSDLDEKGLQALANVLRTVATRRSTDNA